MTCYIFGEIIDLGLCTAQWSTGREAASRGPSALLDTLKAVI